MSKYKYAISAFSALIAAVFSSLASQPGDTLLSAVNASSKKKIMKGINVVDKNSNIASYNNINKNDKINNNFNNIGVQLETKPKLLTKIEIKTETNNNENKTDVELDNPLVIMKQTIDELGFKGLFKGTKARLLHVSFYVVVQFLVYDFVKQSVGLPVTGVH